MSAGVGVFGIVVLVVRARLADVRDLGVIGSVCDGVVDRDTDVCLGCFGCVVVACGGERDDGEIVIVGIMFALPLVGFFCFAAVWCFFFSCFV